MQSQLAMHFVVSANCSISYWIKKSLFKKSKKAVPGQTVWNTRSKILGFVAPGQTSLPVCGRRCHHDLFRRVSASLANTFEACLPQLCRSFSCAHEASQQYCSQGISSSLGQMEAISHDFALAFSRLVAAPRQGRGLTIRIFLYFVGIILLLRALRSWNSSFSWQTLSYFRCCSSLGWAAKQSSRYLTREHSNTFSMSWLQASSGSSFSNRCIPSVPSCISLLTVTLPVTWKIPSCSSHFGSSLLPVLAV